VDHHGAPGPRRPPLVSDPAAILRILLPWRGILAVRIPQRYAERMSPQIAVRLDKDLADRLDALVADGRFATKADAIRTAIEALVEADRQRRIGEAIVEGYRRIPPGDDPGLEAALDAAAHDMAVALDTEERERGVSW